ncbi:MAG: hypothetical protein NWE89_17040 [Candidatus Bathyarchaeota archaeon]|nr:hypothetical protein [Candidatus Bathyarchaeota archaeon]
MSKIFIKAEDKLWPTVIWQGTKLVVYYLGDDPDDVQVRETRGIDFDSLLLHIDRGGSVFITTKPVENDHETGEKPVLRLDEFATR